MFQTYHHTYYTNETFTRLKFDISVRRKSTFYIINLIFPCATLSLIQLSVFAISSRDTTADRIGFGTTNLLTLVVFQTIVTEEMPKTSDAVTTLSKYIISMILMSAIGIFESVWVERLMTRKKESPAMWIRRILHYVPTIFQEFEDLTKLEAKILEGVSESEDEFYSTTQRDSEQAVLLPAVTVGKSNSVSNSAKNHFQRVETCVTMLSDDEEGSDDFLFDRLSSDNYQRRRTASCLVQKSVPSSNSLTNALRTGVTSGKSFKRPSQINNNNDKKDTIQKKVGSKHNRRLYRNRNRVNSKLTRGFELHNQRLWNHVAAKIDTITFALCSALALIVPSFLFLPHMFASQSEASVCASESTHSHSDGYYS